MSCIPNTLAVIGSGVIGSEYACTFAALGAKVHVIDGRDKLLPFLDEEISETLLTAMEKAGVTFHWRETVEKCVATKAEGIVLQCASGFSLTVDAVLVAAGRKSNVEALNLVNAGVKVEGRGLITVNDCYQTNVSHIYAIGDVIGFPALASAAMEQSRRAVAHALDLPKKPLSALLPNGIYTIPEVSAVGETERSLKEKGVKYVVGRCSYAENPRGQIIGDRNGFLKLLFCKSDLTLLGVHVIGELATEIVHTGLIAMMKWGDGGDICRGVFQCADTRDALQDGHIGSLG